MLNEDEYELLMVIVAEFLDPGFQFKEEDYIRAGNVQNKLLNMRALLTARP